MSALNKAELIDDIEDEVGGFVTYDSVWEAIEDTPQDAEKMRIKSQFMIAATEHLNSIEGTQAEKARLAGVTRPRLNALLNGHIDRFSLDALIVIAFNLGLKTEVSVKAA